MSGKGRHSVAGTGLLIAVALLTSAALATDEIPDAEFLEYLGSWSESDEDWLLFSEIAKDPDRAQTAADDIKRIDPAPGGDESTESDDES